MKTILLPLILGLLLMGHAHASTAKQQLNSILASKAQQETLLQNDLGSNSVVPRQAEYALAYLFSPTCQYCKAFSPTLQQFSQNRVALIGQLLIPIAR